MNRDDRIVTLLPDIAEPILHTYYGPRCCVAATAISVHVLKHFGIRATPFELELLVANAEARALLVEKVPVEQWPGTAWSVGIAEADDTVRLGPKDWPGAHLVCVARTEQFGWIVDLSFGQVSRPEKGMPTGAAAMPVTRQWTRQPEPVEWIDDEHGTYVFMRPVLRQEPSRWQGAPDWQPGRWRPIADQVVRAVKAALKVGD